MIYRHFNNYGELKPRMKNVVSIQIIRVCSFSIFGIRRHNYFKTCYDQDFKKCNPSTSTIIYEYINSKHNHIKVE